MLTASICGLTLVRPDGSALPGYAAGAHITVRAPNGQSRSYSLNEAGGDLVDRYVIAVARGRDGGGSTSLVDDTAVGDRIGVLPPRNSFPLVDAKRYLLIAGGIGITPIRAMLAELRERGRDDVRLVYLTRRPDETAYLEEMTGAERADTVRMHHSEGRGRLDLWPDLATPGDTHVFCCGPRSLMDEVRALTMHWDPRTIHFEDFVGVGGPAAGDRPFVVTWQPTGEQIEVGAGQTIVAALRSRGIVIDSSCHAGTCGTCTVRVVGGAVAHRDVVLSATERETMLTACVSRAETGPLTLAPL